MLSDRYRFMVLCPHPLLFTLMLLHCLDIISLSSILFFLVFHNNASKLALAFLFCSDQHPNWIVDMSLD